MKSPAHPTLLILTLLSQLLGGVAVLCVESRGAPLLELTFGECCGGAEDSSGAASLAESADDCGSCQDLPLGEFDRDRGHDELLLALGEVSFLVPVGFPRQLQPASAESCAEPDGLRPLAAPWITAVQVAATVVLTC